MLSERMLTTVVRAMTDKTLTLHPVPEDALPDPGARPPLHALRARSLLRAAVPLLLLQPLPLSRSSGRRDYFQALRQEMRMLKPRRATTSRACTSAAARPPSTIDELCDTIDLARDTLPS